MKKSLPTSNALLAAIRAKCMDCSGNARSLVERCNIHNCPLYPYRSTRAVGEKEQSKEIAGQIGFFDAADSSKVAAWRQTARDCEVCPAKAKGA